MSPPVLLALLACTGTPDAATDSGPGGDTDPVTCGAPTGRDVGDVAEDVVAERCDGASASLSGLCGAPALVVAYYGWCSTCTDNADLARQLAGEHPDLAVAVVLEQDPLGAPVGTDFCAEYEDAYPSSADVWMDPAAALEAYGTTDLVLVLDRDGTIRFERQTSDRDAIVEAVEGVTP